MTSPVFPDIDGALNWYVATKDGLFGLREAIRCGAALSDATLDELFGMTQAQWKTYYRKQAAKHEMFAALALFAACEGGVRLDILPALKDGDSCCQAAMSRRENVPCCIHVAVVCRPAFAARPFSYSQTCSTFRTAGGNNSAARTSLGGVALAHYLEDDTGLMALVFQHRPEH